MWEAACQWILPISFLDQSEKQKVQAEDKYS